MLVKSKLDLQSLAPPIAQKLKRKGIDEAIKEKDISKVRKKRMKKFTRQKK